jgi:hypothetical protein
MFSPTKSTHLRTQHVDSNSTRPLQDRPGTPWTTLTLKKRNAPEKRQNRGCCGSTELPIVVSRRSWSDISGGKLGTLIQQTKNSLNFASTCLKVVDTRRREVKLYLNAVRLVSVQSKSHLLYLRPFCFRAVCQANLYRFADHMKNDRYQQCIEWFWQTDKELKTMRLLAAWRKSRNN